MENNLSESQEIIDGLSAEHIDEEQPDGADEESEEVDEDTAQSIVDYNAKIEALDEELAKHHADNITRMKRQAMKSNRYTDEQVARYVTHITGKTIEEINASVMKLGDEIPANGYQGADPSLFNGETRRPVSDIAGNLYQHGKDTAKRLTRGGKIRL